MHFYLMTLFPEFFDSFFTTSIIKRAFEKKAFDYTIKDIRDHAINKHNQVDDIPYGGGAGMIMRAEPVYDAFKSLNIEDNKKKVLFFSPKGKKIDHNYILDLTNFKNIVLICGHYEGIDQRVIDLIVDEEVSLGDFVLTGGEIPAMALMDGVIRQLSGVISESSLEEESFSHNLLEYRHYTRPRDFKGLTVPEVLLSGHHKEIENFRKEDAVRETLLKRPELLSKEQDSDILKIINKIKLGDKI